MYDWKFTDDIEVLDDLYKDEPVNEEVKMDKVRFIVAAMEYWDYCNHSYAPKPRVLYVYDTEKKREGNLSKKVMFDQYKELGFCKSIQSRNHSCGTREDVNMTLISLPSLVKLRCENNTLYIR